MNTKIKKNCRTDAAIKQRENFSQKNSRKNRNYKDVISVLVIPKESKCLFLK